MVATSEGLSGANPFAGDPNGPYAKANAIANPGTSWTGWYAGLNAGGCWGPGSARFVSADPDPNNALFTLGHQAGVLPVALAPDMKGFSLQDFLPCGVVARIFAIGNFEIPRLLLS